MESFAEIWNYPLFSLSTGGEVTVSQLVMAVLLVVGGLWLGYLMQRALGRFLQRKDVSPHIIETLKRLLFYFILVLLFITALGMMRIPVTALAFISGAVAIGVGFGAQSIINNLISGWILMSERPVRIGDFVEIDSHRGVVENIGNRSTRIKRIDGVHLLVPNSQMLERVVINWTLVDKKFRTSVRVGVAYGSPVRRVQQLLLQAAAEHDFVLDEPAPVAVFEDYGDNALIFDLFFWCEGFGERELRVMRSDIRFRLEELFRENDITVAFPQRDVHLFAGEPVRVTVDRGRNGGGQAS
ncbi:MAG: mechanosensitive ion channel [Xanthomonadales bacterium]